MVNTAIKMGLFKALNATERSTPAELAQKCGAEPVLTGKCMENP